MWEKNNSAKEFVTIGLMSAIVFIATMALNIPNGLGGVVHLGDSMVIVAALMIGKRTAAVSGAIGMMLFDLMSGAYAFWAPYTFVIKLVMGYLIGKIAFDGKRKGDNWSYNIAGILIGGIWMIGGYYIAEAIIYGNIATPMASVPANIIQIAAGAGVAIPLVAALKKTRYFQNRI